MFEDIPFEGGAKPIDDLELTDLAKTGDDPFGDMTPSPGGEESEEEKPEEVPAEEEKEEEPSQEGEEPSEDEDGKNTPDAEDVPFHKHPRFQAVIKERNEMRETLEQLQSKIDSLGEAKTNNSESNSIPGWFRDQAEAQGLENVEELYSNYLEEQKAQKEQLFREWEERQQSKIATERQKEQAMTDWLETEMTKLQEETGLDLSHKGGKNSVRNEILKVANDYQPSDENGNISLSKAHEIWRMLETKKEEEKQEKAQHRKKVAAMTTSEPKAEPKDKPFLTSKELRNKSWDDLI